MRDETKYYSYLNNDYSLVLAGDIKGADPFSEEVLSRNKGFVNYTDLFDKNNSYINFHCYGNNLDDFYCIGSLKLTNKQGNVVIQNDSFRCRADVGLYHGTIVFEDDKDKDYIGNIYIYTPYWCRIQLYYDVGESDLTLLTFEFFKGQFNELPDFMNI